jgi:hypothetical protein
MHLLTFTSAWLSMLYTHNLTEYQPELPINFWKFLVKNIWSYIYYTLVLFWCREVLQILLKLAFERADMKGPRILRKYEKPQLNWLNYFVLWFDCYQSILIYYTHTLHHYNDTYVTYLMRSINWIYCFNSRLTKAINFVSSSFNTIEGISLLKLLFKNISALTEKKYYGEKLSHNMLN